MTHTEQTLDFDIEPPARPDFIETSTKNLLASHARVAKLEAKLAEARKERDDRLRFLLDAPEELGTAPTMYAVAKLLGITKQAVAKIRDAKPYKTLDEIREKHQISVEELEGARMEVQREVDEARDKK